MIAARMKIKFSFQWYKQAKVRLASFNTI